MKLISALFILSVSGGICRAASAPVTTAAAAAVAARTFCQSVGSPVASDPTVTYSTPVSSSDFWRPVWKVRFPEGVDVDVASESGIVTRYSSGWRPSLVGTNLITSDDAVRQATAAIEATGVPPGEVRLDSVELLQQLPPAPPGIPSYAVRWRRLFAGIPYHGVGAAAGVQADTGRLLVFHLLYDCGNPNSTTVNVSPSVAAQTASGCLAAHGLGDQVVADTTLQIVRPNTFWTDKNYHPINEPPRVAWVCICLGYMVDSEVWVDAESGAVIGGYSGGAGAAAAALHKPKPWVPQALSGARAIAVFSRSKSGGWQSKPIGVIASKNEALLASLAKIPPAGTSGHASIIEFRLRVTPTRTPAQPDLDYIPEYKLIGYPGQWYRAPAAFVRWIIHASKH